MDKVILAVGRRKTSTARVVVTPGTGKFRVNGKDVNEYFNVKTLLPEVFKPIEITNLKDKVDIRANVDGGGFRGQADAIKLGIARALVKMDETLRPTLKSEGLLSRDDRAKERKKYGLHSARKDRQYRKR